MAVTNIVIAERNPLFLNGIVTFIERYPNIYNIVGGYDKLTDATNACKEYHTDVLLLGEFSDVFAGTDLLRWVQQQVKTKILCYVEKNRFVTNESILDAGAKGFVWKSSNPEILSRAINVISAGNIYCDDDNLDSDYLQRKPSSGNYLTLRERQIIQLIADGKTNKQIARCLILSNKTIETHRLNLMKKLDVHSGVELLKTALKMGVCTI